MGYLYPFLMQGESAAVRCWLFFEYSLPPAAVLMQPAAQLIAAATVAIGEVPHFCLVRYNRATWL